MNELFNFDNRYKILRNINYLLKIIVINKLKSNDLETDVNFQTLLQILQSGCHSNWDFKKLISFENDLITYYKENIKNGI